MAQMAQMALKSNRWGVRPGFCEKWNQDEAGRDIEENPTDDRPGDGSESHGDERTSWLTR